MHQGLIHELTEISELSCNGPADVDLCWQAWLYIAGDCGDLQRASSSTVPKPEHVMFDHTNMLCTSAHGHMAMHDYDAPTVKQHRCLHCLD